MSTERRKRHSPEQIVKKLRDADAMLNAGKYIAAVLRALEVSESTLERWRCAYRQTHLLVEPLNRQAAGFRTQETSDGE